MKKKILILVLILLAGYFYYSYTSENEKYRILNEIIQDNKIWMPKICSKSSTIQIFEDNLSDFTFIEQLWVNYQKVTQTSIDFKSDKIQYFNGDSKLHYSKIILDCDKENDFVYKISMPIVSPNKETAIIKITEDCNCMLGGQSGTYLYKKIDGKWKMIKMLDGWIS